jgi:hypothetical protein
MLPPGTRPGTAAPSGWFRLARGGLADRCASW